MFEQSTAPRQVAPAPIGFWPTIGWLGAAVIAALLFICAMLASYAFFVGQLPNEADAEEWLPPGAYIALAVSLIAIVKRAGWSAKDYFALKRPTWRQLIIATAIGATFPVIDNIVACLDTGLRGVGFLFQYGKAAAGNLLSLYPLNAVLVAPIAEEMAFRGFLYRNWSQTRLGHAGAIKVSAVLFGLMHFDYGWSGMLTVAISGLLLGWLRWWSGSLIPPILAHATSNALFTTLWRLIE